ncbi:MAG: YraN family protein [Capnocytophaga sp.]|nr:YraN family protein [Capnocytophaga sp.]
MAEHNDFGKESEQEAVSYLEKNGYIILERNYIYQSAEIDIIAQKGNILIIVEVKSRKSAYFGEPYSFVNPRKIQLLAKAANYYIEKNNLEIEVRFDIISIIKNEKTHEIKHLEDAFYPF